MTSRCLMRRLERLEAHLRPSPVPFFAFSFTGGVKTER